MLRHGDKKREAIKFINWYFEQTNGYPVAATRIFEVALDNGITKNNLDRASMHMVKKQQLVKYVEGMRGRMHSIWYWRPWNENDTRLKEARDARPFHIRS